MVESPGSELRSLHTAPAAPPAGGAPPAPPADATTPREDISDWDEDEARTSPEPPPPKPPAKATPKVPAVAGLSAAQQAYSAPRPAPPTPQPGSARGPASSPVSSGSKPASDFNNLDFLNDLLDDARSGSAQTPRDPAALITPRTQAFLDGKATPRTAFASPSATAPVDQDQQRRLSQKKTDLFFRSNPNSARSSGAPNSARGARPPRVPEEEVVSAGPADVAEAALAAADAMGTPAGSTQEPAEQPRRAPAGAGFDLGFDENELAENSWDSP